MTDSSKRPVTLATLKQMKARGEKVAVLTAYDASQAALLDAAGVDVVLVGDSLGMVVQGRDSTLPVNMTDMLYHSRSVAAGLRRSLLMVDMPFMSYAWPERAMDNAARLMQEGLAHMIKLEGGGPQLETVRRLSEQGIPICAHLGLQPQSVHKMGGYKVQGREADVAQRMLDDAVALQQAGADVLLLECVPSALAEEISLTVELPVIGIGAGPATDGQVLVLYDVLGISHGHIPKFAHNFMAGAPSIQAAVEAYVEAVKSARFPQPEHSFS